LPNYRVIDKPFTAKTLTAAVASAMLDVTDDAAAKAQSAEAGSR
jgi:hypothetical protein